MGKKLENLKKQIKPKTRKGMILGIVFGIITPIIGGVVAGIVISKFFLIETTDISKIDTTTFKTDNSEKAYTKYLTATNNGEKMVEDFSTSFSASDIFAISYKLFSSHENNFSMTVGNTLAAGLNQSIRGATIKNGGKYFEESISKSSMVGLANRIYMPAETKASLYMGEAKSSVEGSYKSEHYEFTAEEYADIYGKTPVRPLIYIVNSKTILKGTDKVTKTDNGYTVNVSLDTKKGVYDYMKQMKNISGLSGYPAFEYCRLTLEVDNTLLVKHLHIEEKYSAQMGIVGSVCDAVINIKYEVDGDTLIPELNSPLTYPEEI